MNILDFKKDTYRYFTFIIGGSLSLVLNVGLTYGLTEYFKLWHMLSFTIALALEIIFLFGYHSLITFRQQGDFFSFVAIILVVSGLNWLAVYLLSDVLHIYYVVSIIVAAGVISVLNYYLNKKMVFRNKDAAVK